MSCLFCLSIELANNLIRRSKISEVSAFRDRTRLPRGVLVRYYNEPFRWLPVVKLTGAVMLHALKMAW